MGSFLGFLVMTVAILFTIFERGFIRSGLRVLTVRFESSLLVACLG